MRVIMAKRIRIFQWSIDKNSFGRLRRGLQNRPYDEDRGSGFVLEHSSAADIRGSFVQRITYVEETRMPDGEVTESPRTSYSFTRFEATPENQGLVVIDPPRSVAALLQEFAALTAYDVSINSCSVRLERLYLELKRIDRQMELTKVKLSAIQIDEASVADLTVSDKKDALEKAKQVIGDRRSMLSRFDCKFGAPGERFNLTVTSTGSVTLTSTRPTDLSAIRAAIAKAASRP